MPEPFAGATGRGVRVAVIDSGVHAGHPHVGGVAGGVSIGGEGPADDYSDVLGHGTAVMAAIKEKAPDAVCFAVRVFHRSLRTSIGSLLLAVEWCLEERIDVINLSLGTSNTAHAERFGALLDRAARQGALLVSARDNEGVPAIPGSLPGVIGVGLDWDLPREVYACRASEAGVEFYASGYPRALPGVSRERNLQGISFAVANMTGFVLRACERSGERSFARISSALVEAVADGGS